MRILCLQLEKWNNVFHVIKPTDEQQHKELTWCKSIAGGWPTTEHENLRTIQNAIHFCFGPSQLVRICRRPGPPTGALGVTRFVCVNCTATGHLQVSSRVFFLHRAGVCRHISASNLKAGFATDFGFKEIHDADRPAGPAPDIRHQPPGTTI